MLPADNRGCSRASLPELSMSNDKVVPFRKRPPSAVELEVYRRITRSWHPDMRRLMLPEHFKRDQRGTKD